MYAVVAAVADNVSITLTDEPFHVPQFYAKGGPFAAHEIHTVSGVASVSGGTLTVKAPNASYTMTLSAGTVGPSTPNHRIP